MRERLGNIWNVEILIGKLEVCAWQAVVESHKLSNKTEAHWMRIMAETMTDGKDGREEEFSLNRGGRAIEGLLLSNRNEKQRGNGRHTLRSHGG